MSKQEPNHPPILKLMATENRSAFNKLHRDLVAEFKPSGAPEETIISSLAKCLWRVKALRRDVK
jgi:hypothetical protein